MYCVSVPELRCTLERKKDMNYYERALALKDETIAHRRWFHTNAEVGLHMPKGQAYVLEELKKLGIEAKACGNGVTAALGKPGKCILLRADMDALPMAEESGLDFACKSGTEAHCCGHDFHVAMLLTAAKMLKENEDALEGTVKFMFQPAEEIFEGAKDMLENGVLENPRPGAAVMLHVTAGAPMPAGMVITMAPGVSAPAADYFTIRVQGRGCHGSTPHQGVDALTAAAHILLALQELHARELAPGTEAVLTVGTIQGGTAPNAIADSCELRGTIRTYDENTRTMLKNRMAEISAAVASAAGGTVYGAAATAGGVVLRLCGFRNSAVEEHVSVLRYYPGIRFHIFAGTSPSTLCIHRSAHD